MSTWYTQTHRRPLWVICRLLRQCDAHKRIQISHRFEYSIFFLLLTILRLTYLTMSLSFSIAITLGLSLSLSLCFSLSRSLVFLDFHFLFLCMHLKSPMLQYYRCEEQMRVWVDDWKRPTGTVTQSNKMRQILTHTHTKNANCLLNLAFKILDLTY